VSWQEFAIGPYPDRFSAVYNFIPILVPASRFLEVCTSFLLYAYFVHKIQVLIYDVTLQCCITNEDMQPWALIRVFQQLVVGLKGVADIRCISVKRHFPTIPKVQLRNWHNSVVIYYNCFLNMLAFLKYLHQVDMVQLVLKHNNCSIHRYIQ
jgi:hypothetical protein